MKRRAFLTLVGAAGAVPLVPGGSAAAQDPAEPWRFDVDGRLRWRLFRGGQAAVAGAAVAVELDGRLVRLDQLEDVRRHRGGTSEAGVWLVAGRSAETEISAEFIDDAERPYITVRVRGLGTRRSVRAVTYLDTADGAVVPAHRAAGARAWINGFQSWSGCRVVEAARADATGHWQLALTAGHSGTAAQRHSGLGFSFGENDTGLGEFVLQGGQLRAVSQCGDRPVGFDVAPVVCTLTLAPAADEPRMSFAAKADRATTANVPKPIKTRRGSLLFIV